VLFKDGQLISAVEPTLYQARYMNFMREHVIAD
jgi:hypothetical protein